MCSECEVKKPTKTLKVSELGVVSMQWNKDPLIYEKSIIYESIICFSKIFEDKEFSQISLHMLIDFIDKFCEKKVEDDKSLDASTGIPEGKPNSNLNNFDEDNYI